MCILICDICNGSVKSSLRLRELNQLVISCTHSNDKYGNLLIIQIYDNNKQSIALPENCVIYFRYYYYT